MDATLPPGKSSSTGKLLTVTAVVIVLLGFAFVAYRLTPGSVRAERKVGLGMFSTLGTVVLDSTGKPIEELVIVTRARSMLDLMNGRNVQIEQGGPIQVNLWQRWKGAGEFTLRAPQGVSHNLGNFSDPARPLTNVAMVLRLNSAGPMNVSFGSSPGIEMVSLTSDQLDITNGQKQWKDR